MNDLAKIKRERAALDARSRRDIVRELDGIARKYRLRYARDGFARGTSAGPEEARDIGRWYLLWEELDRRDAEDASKYGKCRQSFEQPSASAPRKRTKPRAGWKYAGFKKRKRKGTL